MLFLSIACLVASFVYSMCTLLCHFASAFNIFSLFTYLKKKTVVCYTCLCHYVAFLNIRYIYMSMFKNINGVFWPNYLYLFFMFLMLLLLYSSLQLSYTLLQLAVKQLCHWCCSCSCYCSDDPSTLGQARGTNRLGC